MYEIQLSELISGSSFHIFILLIWKAISIIKKVYVLDL